jgi:hypothetical protein
MLKGLAFLRAECVGPVAGDYGEDLLGGSTTLREVKPWDRTPRWRGRAEGPPSNYDVALHLDFDDQAGLDAYNKDDVHHAVGDYNAAINEAELTARVDWWYDGPPLTRPGFIRHSAMFVWTDESGAGERKAAQDAIRELQSAPGVESLSIGDNVGPLKTDYDWLYDIQLVDRAATDALLASAAYADAIKKVAAASKYEWTARVTHIMRGS